MSLDTFTAWPIARQSRPEAWPQRFRARAARLGHDVELDVQPGWLAVDAVAQAAFGDALAAHAGWPGPWKLVHGPTGVCQRFEAALPRAAVGQGGMSDGLDQQRAAAILRRATLRAALGCLAEPSRPAGGNRLAPAALRAWVQAEGFAVAAAGDGQFSLAVTHGGFSAQVCICCSPDSLRMEMPLGQWADLSRSAEAAMLQLVVEANAAVRLVRLVWQAEGASRQCRAEVDLTGVPWVEPEHPAFEPVARSMVEASLAGLRLTGRRLGRELAALADPSHGALVEAFHNAAKPQAGDY